MKSPPLSRLQISPWFARALAIFEICSQTETWGRESMALKPSMSKSTDRDIKSSDRLIRIRGIMGGLLCWIMGLRTGRIELVELLLLLLLRLWRLRGFC